MLIGGSLMKVVGNDEIKDAFMKEFQSEFQKGMEAEMGGDRRPLPQVLNALLFVKINQARTEQSISRLENDQQLCAYATRRIQQMEEFGGFDDLAGFIEDGGDQKIWQSFFKGYSSVNNFHYPIYSSVDEKDIDRIVSDWSEKANEDSDTVLNSTYTHGCVRSNEDRIVLILGGN